MAMTKGVTCAPMKTTSADRMSSAAQNTATGSGSRPMGGKYVTPTSGDVSIQTARRVPGALK